MASEVIGWIEMDEVVHTAALLSAVQPFSFRPRSCSTQMTADSVCSAQTAITEFIAADFCQLQTELELEFARFLQRKQAK